jgi:hypothetical protein
MEFEENLAELNRRLDAEPYPANCASAYSWMDERQLNPRNLEDVSRTLEYLYLIHTMRERFFSRPISLSGTTLFGFMKSSYSASIINLDVLEYYRLHHAEVYTNKIQLVEFIQGAIDKELRIMDSLFGTRVEEEMYNDNDLMRIHLHRLRKRKSIKIA